MVLSMETLYQIRMISFTSSQILLCFFQINDITRFTVNNPCGDIQMAVVLAMLNSQESITFDPSTRTKAIGQMVEKVCMSYETVAIYE